MGCRPFCQVYQTLTCLSSVCPVGLSYRPLNALYALLHVCQALACSRCGSQSNLFIAWMRGDSRLVFLPSLLHGVKERFHPLSSHGTDADRLSGQLYPRIQMKTARPRYSRVGCYKTPPEPNTYSPSDCSYSSPHLLPAHWQSSAPADKPQNPTSTLMRNHAVRRRPC